ncbi:amino acid ABC transporter substrate-binding protein [Streptacidiphilus fuscans]|uniref:Amino acid ABC transporter substrate-binding protein n=1 Tax=Streptacidiphilus fuscans TaxID=2789292 RepID=A0A931B338_9ACTN|nr:amino acid ABC transporter substrate-binding protein [Streptacidiphilus fuscans]MBF9068086.1 amino acid ABC transporter substrate-binding protein [Streptacidiphilus fuscans]
MSTQTIAAPAATFDRVRANGALRVVVSQGIAGLSQQGPDGSWSGLDVDIARAVAAAVTGRADAVEWLPTDPADRLDRLVSGEADLVTCNLTWTLGREATAPVLFTGVTCYDGEGFLVRAADGITGAEQLAGRRLAVQAGTTSAANLAAWFGSRGLAVEPVACPTPAATLAAFVSGECSAYVLDRVALAGIRASLPDPEAHLILADTISREPMAMAVRDDDPAWFRACRWVLQFLTAAEHAAAEAPEGGREQALAAVAQAADSRGAALGLMSGWAFAVLDAVGTYGDIYARNLGPASGLDVPRGLNALWTDGGLHYPIPFG